MKVVKSAKIQIVSFKDLKIGDHILFKNQNREIADINGLNGFIALSNPTLRNREGFNAVKNYYKIIECEEEEISE
jgi:predicted RNA-binding protein with PUA-like domain